MVYPKGLIDFICNNKELSSRFADQILNPPSNSSKKKASIKINEEFELWLIKEGYRKSSAIRRYLLFLTKMAKNFNGIYKVFKKINPERINKKDYNAIQSSPQELLYIASYLYCLDSFGVKGDLIECGCFKGFSSICLSWVCNFLGKKLIVADSFEGLPINSETVSKKTLFRPQDFKGNFEEVRENIKRYGKNQNVEFIKGWFNESLLGFHNSICLLWMDVDIYQSAKDILYNIFVNLSRGAVIFSHEFSKIAVDQNDRIIRSKYVKGPPMAIADFLDENNIPYKAKYLTGDLGIIIPVINGADKRILLSPHKQKIIEYLTNYSSLDVLKFLIFKLKDNLFFSLIIQIISKSTWISWISFFLDISWIFLGFLFKLLYFLSRFG